MVFESVRGYVQLASGLSELTRARATEAAQGLLSLQGAGIATGSKALVRSEVDVAVTRMGLVAAEKLAASQAEAARLRAEVAALRLASRATPAKKTAVKKATAKKTAVKKAAAKKTTAKKTAVKRTAVRKTAARDASATGAAAKPVTMATTTPRSATTPRRKPVGT